MAASRIRQYLVEKTITVEREDQDKFDGKWAIQHRIGISDKEMYKASCAVLGKQTKHVGKEDILVLANLLSV
eukprot:5606661-Amphidinium_carterae.1